MREKFDAYEHAGVKEYWVVQPGEGTVLVYVWQNGVFKGDQLTPRLFPELSVNSDAVFE
ncbi:MAG: Uma2 family endonuclease [Cyclobacteriaceae bacterium]|nr:Uma2 family endonuclease [Cyclobacteriaceae bacterium]